MSLPNHSIQPVREADLPFLASFLHTSKLALPINRLLFKEWPNDAAQKPLYAGAMRSGFEDADVDDLKCVDADTGEIVAYIAISRKRPGPDPTADRLKRSDAGKGDFFHPDIIAAVTDAVGEINRDVQNLDRIELTYICVKPSLRRRGIGSLLVQIAFDKAKAEGLPLVVLSEPEAHPFMVKQGFTDRKHVDIDLAKWAAPYSGFGLFRLFEMIWNDTK